MYLNSNEYQELVSIIKKCYCPEKIKQPNGDEFFGFYNLKRLYGMPNEFQKTINILSNCLSFYPLCAPDVGISPFIGALSLIKGIPSIYVRNSPKYYYLSYGSKQEHNTPWVFGDFLESGQKVQIFDDVIDSGSSIIKTVQILQEINIVVDSVVCIMSIEDKEKAINNLSKYGITNIKILLEVSEISDNLGRKL
jgi:orotate phosphoribosyltransferase